ncbi:MAG TPA: alpha/beta hydrolase [bacterium]|nr:alpha/beta hydrolase [bacterium]
MFDDEQPFRFRGPDGLELTGHVWSGAESPRLPELLFSPGNGFPMQVYRPALEGLPADAVVHAINHRGHGGSEVPGQLSDWDGLLADLRAYVEQRMHAPVILAGHSMGSMLALRLAAEAPALAAGLLLLEPPLHERRGKPRATRTPEHEAFIERSRNRRDTWASREEAAAWFAGSVGYRQWSPEARAAFVAEGLVEAPDGSVRLATPPWLEAALYETVPQQTVYQWAEQVRCPTVLLRGLESWAAPAEVMEDLADALPVAVVLPVPGTHTFPMEHPAETGHSVTKALRILRGETGLAAT